MLPAGGNDAIAEGASKDADRERKPRGDDVTPAPIRQVSAPDPELAHQVRCRHPRNMQCGNRDAREEIAHADVLEARPFQGTREFIEAREPGNRPAGAPAAIDPSQYS